MQRRAFIAVLCAVAAGATDDVRAQGMDKKLAIGWLSPRTPASETEVTILTAFLRGLGEAGYIEGRNVGFEYRYAEGRYDRLPDLAQDLVGRRVSIIVTSAGLQAAQAAQAATRTIPIVFASASDPVREGLVRSISRPGGNITGAYLFNNSLGPKRLETLLQLVPGAGSVGLLVNPDTATTPQQSAELRDAARRFGVELVLVEARNASEIDLAFASLASHGVRALVIGADPFFQVRQSQLVELAERQRLPTIYEWPEFVRAGGLITYTADRTEMWRQLGVYAGRILKGEAPGDLPVIQPSKFELVVNLKAARLIGLKVNESFLRLADEVIE